MNIIHCALCLQPLDDTTTMTKARVMASSDDINWQQLIQIIITHIYTCVFVTNQGGLGNNV